MDWNTYLKNERKCDCGRSHGTKLEEVAVGEHVLEQLPGWIFGRGVRRVFVVSDCNTYPVAGERTLALLKGAGLEASGYIYPDKALVPDESALGRFLTALPPKTELLVAVGAGTLGDLCRFVGYKMGIPFVTVATAPSMDGFSSNVAPLITNHLKTTYEARVPLAVFGDINIMRQAPLPMLAAGAGDILGKHVCLLDWRISHLVTGEYHCAAIEKMVEDSLRTVTESVPCLSQRNPEAVRAVMDALVLSGVAISYAGNSRPASGSEHHLSHYWEMQFLFEGKPPVLHGTKVAIGTVAAVWMYQKLLSIPVGFGGARRHAMEFDREKWEANIRAAYGPAAESVVALEQEAGKNAPERVLARLDFLETHWEEIRSLIRARLPRLETFVGMLQSLQAPWTPGQVGIREEQVADAVRYAKDLRNRYGLLQLLFDLGVQEDMIKGLTDFYRAEGERHAQG